VTEGALHAHVLAPRQGQLQGPLQGRCRVDLGELRRAVAGQLLEVAQELIHAPALLTDHSQQLRALGRVVGLALKELGSGVDDACRVADLVGQSQG